MHSSCSASPCTKEQAAPREPSPPAAAAATPEGRSPALAAYERSISRAQKIQMESLQRQLKVQQCPMHNYIRKTGPLGGSSRRWQWADRLA